MEHRDKEAAEAKRQRKLLTDLWGDRFLCHGCGRPLVRKTRAGWLTKSWFGVCVTRRRDLDGGSVRLPDGSEVTVSEYPMVCSRACVLAVSEAWPKSPHHDLMVGAAKRETAKALFFVGEEVVGTKMGLSPMPDAPPDHFVFANHTGGSRVEVFDLEPEDFR